jgi:hypothetical protein
MKDEGNRLVLLILALNGGGSGGLTCFAMWYSCNIFPSISSMFSFYAYQSVAALPYSSEQCTFSGTSLILLLSLALIAITSFFSRRSLISPAGNFDTELGLSLALTQVATSAGGASRIIFEIIAVNRLLCSRTLEPLINDPISSTSSASLNLPRKGVQQKTE